MKLVGYNSQMETTIDSLRSTAVLLVGFFARARASVLAIVVASATAVGLAACGGGGGDSASGSTAYFHGAERVEGLQYRYIDGGSGETDARGGFQFEQGKTVVFSVGEATTLGTVVVSSDAERDFVTPLRFVGNNEDQAVRVERLLIALDTDVSDSVINIPAAALTLATNLLTIAQLQVGGDGRNDGATMEFNVGGLILNIPDTDRARQELMDTNNCAYSGSFAGRLSDGISAALVLMPNLTLDLTLDLIAETVTLTTASPAVSFIDESGTVKVGETVLTIDLKTPPLTITIAGGLGTMTLASYDRIEFGGGTVFGTLRRVAGDPNADYRLVGIYYGDSNSNSDEGAFVADIYNGGNAQSGNAQISDISNPNFQNTASATRMGVFPTSTPTALTLGVGGVSATLTLFADPKIFSGAGDGDAQSYEGFWCEL